MFNFAKTSLKFLIQEYFINSQNREKILLLFGLNIFLKINFLWTFLKAIEQFSINSLDLNFFKKIN